jgi:hypothetical protein
MIGYIITKKGVTQTIVPLHEPDEGLISKSAVILAAITDGSPDGYHLDNINLATFQADIADARQVDIDEIFENKLYNVLSIWQK